MPSVVRSNRTLKIGFVPLLDAAPIIAALELGFFADEGLSVVLDRQIGWGNVRDKLTFGQLQASHALLGMPAASVLRKPQFHEHLVGLLELGSGGNAITISKRLYDLGVRSASSLGKLSRRATNGSATPMLAHVFDCSTHQYLLRDWLASGQLDPDRDVRMCVLPPLQMVRQMTNGYVDVFCVGEPWGSVAEAADCGRIIIKTTDMVAEHPEKVLAVSRKWLDAHPSEAAALSTALLRAGEYCGQIANRSRLIEILSHPKYLAIDSNVLSRSLATGVYRISAASMFPSATHVAWLLSRMHQWKHLPANVDIAHIAALSMDSAAFRQAAQAAGVTCPEGEFPPMQLRSGMFTVEPKTEALLLSQNLRSEELL